MSPTGRTSRTLLALFPVLFAAVAARSAGAVGPGPPIPVNTRDWPVTRAYNTFSPAGDAAWTRSAAAGHAFGDSVLRAARASHDRVLEAAAHAWRGRKYANVYRLAEGAADLDTAWTLSSALRDSSGLARVIAARAHGANLLGKTEEATRGFTKLVPLARAAGMPGLEGFAHRSLGYISKNAGRYPEARRHLLEAIRLLPPEHFDNLHSRFLLAEVDNRRGRHDEARTQFVALLAEGRARRQPIIVASCLNDLGNLEYEGGDMAKADEWWTIAAATFDSLESPPSAVNARINRVHALRILGRTADARALLDRLVRECARIQDPSPRVAAYGEMALLEQRLGRTARAETLFRRVMIESVDDAEGQEYATINLATLLRQNGRPREAEAELDSLLAPARAGRMLPGNLSAAWLERSACRRALGRPGEALPWARAADLRLRRERETSMYGLEADLELARCYRDAGKADSAVFVLRRAARDWERWRSAISDLEWRERSGSGLAELFADYGLALLDRRRAAPPARRVREAFDALQAFQARTLEERMHGLGLSGKAMRSRVTADSLRRGVLRDGELLVDVVASPDTSLAFLVSRGGLEVRGLPGTTRLDRLYADWRGAALSGASDAVVAAGLRRLSDVLLAPMAEPLRRSRRLILSGGGPLALWPLAALTLPGETATLGETRELCTVPSATLFAVLRTRRALSPAGPLLAVGRTTDANGRELPGAERELRSLASEYRGAEVRFHRGERTVPEITGDLPRWNVLHFAAEAEARPGNPWRSGLLLGKGSGDDAFLRASRVAAMKLGAQLAVLSGCQSAGATTLAGEGAVGLAGAFLCAGATSVVATLWPVEDRVAQRFADQFYAQLASGRTVAGAVAAAQRQLRSRPETAQVRDWGAFVAAGEAATRVRLARRGGR